MSWVFHNEIGLLTKWQSTIEYPHTYHFSLPIDPWSSETQCSHTSKFLFHAFISLMVNCHSSDAQSKQLLLLLPNQFLHPVNLTSTCPQSPSSPIPLPLPYFTFTISWMDLPKSLPNSYIVWAHNLFQSNSSSMSSFISRMHILSCQYAAWHYLITLHCPPGKIWASLSVSWKVWAILPSLFSYSLLQLYQMVSYKVHDISHFLDFVHTVSCAWKAFPSHVTTWTTSIRFSDLNSNVTSQATPPWHPNSGAFFFDLP